MKRNPGKIEIPFGRVVGWIDAAEDPRRIMRRGPLACVFPGAAQIERKVGKSGD